MTQPHDDGPPTQRIDASAAASDSDGAERMGSGIAALVQRHPAIWLASALGLIFALLGTGAVVAGLAAGSPASSQIAGSTPSPTPTVDPARPVPASIPGPSRLRTCSVTGAASDARLAEFHGQVVNAATGEVLFDRAGGEPARTGSVLKILTAAAAVAVLGPDHRLSTTVVAGSDPGTVVLVGGGDATLSALPPGSESYYRGAPKLADLATQVMSKRAELGITEPITRVVLDASMWSSSDKWDPAWKRSEQTIGYHSEVTALQVDGDRADPTRGTSPRSTDPIGRAGAAFVAALENAGNVGDESNGGAVALDTGVAASTTALGTVSSQPVSALINQMLLVSDNTIAEMLARVTSKQAGFDGSAASLQRAIPGALATYGVETAGMVIKDGSGLSEFNAVAPSYVAQLMIKIKAGEQNLGTVWAGLPIAGKSGSLASRFTGDNAVARGNVVAKTGWIDTGYALGGFINAADGTPLTFAFYAIGNVRDNAKAALDTLTTAVLRCGDNLSNT